jgi:predicted nuclease of predicted toxin-antitoxin system
MLRLLTDENVNKRIVRGLIRRIPRLDVLSVKDVGLMSSPDLIILCWAANEDRIILTHDRKTMVPDAEQLIAQGEPVAGVILVPDGLGIGRAITDIELAVQCYSESEMRNRIIHLPL